ncbi:MAG TPA: tetratricopeptide repeat protein [Ktedonobacterales bacterium]
MGRMGYRGGAAGNMGGIQGGDLNRAKLALQGNRPDEAERLLRKWLDRRPNDAGARLLLAQALLQLQRVDDGLAEARRVTREQTTNADAFLILSAALLQKQSPKSQQEAEDAARRAVQLQPRAARAHVQLAEVLAARRNLADAKREAEEAARLEPRLPAAHLIRGMVLLANEEPAEAITACESALRYDNTLFAAHFTMANAMIEVRRYDDALAALDRAKSLNPLLPENQVAALRGRIHLKQRKFGTAYRDFATAQRASGRLTWLAPFSAALSMTQVFGRWAPVVVIAVLALLILLGLSFIPFVGPWIVVVLVLALLGVSFFGSLRSTQGAILPEGTQRLPGLAAMVVAGVALFALIFWAVSSLTHARGLNPLIVLFAGVGALAAAAGASYVWPRIMVRLGRPRAAATAR